MIGTQPILVHFENQNSRRTPHQEPIPLGGNPPLRMSSLPRSQASLSDPSHKDRPNSHMSKNRKFGGIVVSSSFETNKVSPLSLQGRSRCYKKRRSFPFADFPRGGFIGSLGWVLASRKWTEGGVKEMELRRQRSA
jgi:hypothetical protein